MPVYLLHFDQPFKHARHYCGYSKTLESLERRIEAHRRARANDGQHHRLMVAIAEAGIGFQVARVWPEGTQADERRQKRRGHASKCPICRAEQRAGRGGENEEAITKG